MTANVGCPVSNSGNTALSIPVQFALTGKDPFTSQNAWKYETIDVGASPVIFLYNKNNPAGLGATSGGIPILQDVTSSNAAQVWNGAQGGAAFLNPALANVPITILLDSPLSDTMNAAEFTTFRTFLAPTFAAPKNSQETGIDFANSCWQGVNCPNPLYLPTTNGGGVRERAVGTDDMVYGDRSTHGLRSIWDSIGYILFSNRAVSPLAGASGAGRYVTLDGVDPIMSTYTNGQLPTWCMSPCGVAPGTSFPHIRDGSYRAWSIIRLVTDASGANRTNAQALVTAAQNGVNSTVPDFVPFAPTPDGDPGLQYLHSNFYIAGIDSKVATKAMTETGNVVAATLASNPFIPGQLVTVSGVTPTGYNGNFKVLTSSGLLITYSDPTSGLANATVQGKVNSNGGDAGGCPFRVDGSNATQVNVRLNGATASASNFPWPGGSCDLSPNHN